MNDEEVAFKIVRLYFEEIARLGFKRQLDLYQIINAYFYSLKRLGNKEVEINKAVAKIIKEESEKAMEKDVNKVTGSEVENSKTIISSNTSQSNNSNNNKLNNSNNNQLIGSDQSSETKSQTKERTITDILEGK